MEKSEMLWIATKYFSKGYDYETMCYGKGGMDSSR